jgi:uncharacterized membrane protein
METIPPAQTPAPPALSEDKTVAIVSYLTFVGFIVAIVIHNGKKTRLGAFHLRQMLGYFLTGIVVYPCGLILAFIPIIGCLAWPCLVLFGLAMLVLWILGLIAAVNGQMNPMPIVGPLYQKWFGNAFD